MITLTQTTTDRYWAYALWLSLFTIFYKLAEGLIWFSYNEGKETFEKAAGMEDCCDDDNCTNKK